MKNAIFILLIIFKTTVFSQKVEDNFEGNGTISVWFADSAILETNFLNPFKIGINNSDKVLKYTDNGGQYANVGFDVATNFNLAVNYTFTLKVYVPSNGITGNQANQVSLKLQNNSIAEPWFTQTEIIKPISLDVWQEISFDFKNDTFINQNSGSSLPINRTDFNRVLIQLNGENNNDKVVAYIDDFSFDGVLPSNNVGEENTNYNTLVWSDEFDGSGPIDNSKWHHQIIPIINGNTNWANGEIQHYTDRTDNSYVSNGTLKIVAKKEFYTFNNATKNYTSARLNSKYAFTYGKVEIKAKMPFGVGTFPALWMLGQNITEFGGYWAATHGTTPWPDCGEIDIIEHWGDNQDFVQSALHNRSSFGGTVNKGGRRINNASTEFHIYTLDWNANRMIFSVDGIEHYTYNPDNKNAENWPYYAPQYLLFNVAILPNITPSFTESAMEIDYVRVYQESSSLNVNSFIKEEQVKIVPNPFQDHLTLQVPTHFIGLKATIYSVLGKEVDTFVLNKESFIRDTNPLQNGIYFLKISGSDKVFNYKILKK